MSDTYLSLRKQTGFVLSPFRSLTCDSRFREQTVCQSQSRRRTAECFTIWLAILKFIHG